jgi:hypothetical protein
MPDPPFLFFLFFFFLSSSSSSLSFISSFSSLSSSSLFYLTAKYATDFSVSFPPSFVQHCHIISSLYSLDSVSVKTWDPFLAVKYYSSFQFRLPPKNIYLIYYIQASLYYSSSCSQCPHFGLNTFWHIVKYTIFASKFFRYTFIP